MVWMMLVAFQHLYLYDSKKLTHDQFIINYHKNYQSHQLSSYNNFKILKIWRFFLTPGIDGYPKIKKTDILTKMISNTPLNWDIGIVSSDACRHCTKVVAHILSTKRTPIFFQYYIKHSKPLYIYLVSRFRPKGCQNSLYYLLIPRNFKF